MYRTLWSATWTLLKLAGVEGLFGPAGLTPPGPPFGRYPSPATHSLGPFPVDESLAPPKDGWGGRIRTSVWRDQNPLPYRLATPQCIQSANQKPDRLIAGRQSVEQGRVVQSAS